MKFKIFFIVALIGIMVFCAGKEQPTIEEEVLTFKEAMQESEPVDILKGKIIDFRSLGSLDLQVAILEVRYSAISEGLRDVFISPDLVGSLKRGNEVCFVRIPIMTGTELTRPSFIVSERKVQELVAFGAKIHEPYSPYRE